MMENLPYENLSELVIVLNALSSNDELRQKEAAKIMTEMVVQPTKFVDSMMGIVLTGTEETGNFCSFVYILIFQRKHSG